MANPAAGKTTLLKMLKRELAPHGEKSGSIRYHDVEQAELDDRTAACEIGYVLQNPENQVVTDKVWHELAFGLESLGFPTDVIRAPGIGNGQLFLVSRPGSAKIQTSCPAGRSRC